MLNGVMEGGPATWSDDSLLVLDRNGYPEECYFTFSYSPIRDESGGIGAMKRNGGATMVQFQLRTRSSGMATTKRPPHVRTTDICAITSGARGHARINT